MRIAKKCSSTSPNTSVTLDWEAAVEWVKFTFFQFRCEWNEISHPFSSLILLLLLLLLVLLLSCHLRQFQTSSALKSELSFILTHTWMYSTRSPFRLVFLWPIFWGFMNLTQSIQQCSAKVMYICRRSFVRFEVMHLRMVRGCVTGIQGVWW